MLKTKKKMKVNMANPPQREAVGGLGKKRRALMRRQLKKLQPLKKHMYNHSCSAVTNGVGVGKGQKDS